MNEERQIDITPTPAGFGAMTRMFLEQQQQSQTIMDRCEEVLLLLDTDDYVLTTIGLDVEPYELEKAFLTAAVEAYASQERQRIASMQEGLDDLAKGGYE